ncbi:MAG: iron ABC transporter permease [Clostridia bacterium]|nr:iron ABC transporter permease [Clostridia bacterium]
MLLSSAILGLLLGSTKTGFLEVVRVIFGLDSDDTAAKIILYVRLPRMLAGLLCGGALALSGTVIQGVLLNKLASPGIIGVNSGAALAVTLAAAFGIIGGWKISLCAFLGAFLTVMAVTVGAKKWEASRGTVILMGVALNALFGAISDAVVTFSPEISIINSDFKVGDLSSVTYSELLPAAIIIITAAAVTLTLRNSLDVLTLGDENARGLGMNTSLMRAVLLLLSALLAGAAVSMVGLLSFVGLLVPHTLRKTVTSESKHLLPLTLIFGAGFVSLCDTLARVIFAPYELPVGIIMAFIGAPTFLVILVRKRGKRNA